MRCHYEVLEVSRDADESEIKTAYRKLALKWHPDKNLENSENAKEQFQIVQQAYEVLSDRQERAWYDNHREQILRGANSEFEDKSLDVFQYFTATCFQGYEDGENGFYSIYRNVFEKLAKEDMDFMEDKEEFCEIPSFGNSVTSYEKVSEFYAYWLNYSTKKSYVWLDPYDIKDIRDRRYLKMVEKENKKIRQKAKKERNEEVRNLVAFVRKRDRRVQAQKKVQEQKLLEDKKKRESLSKQKRLERQEEFKNIADQPEWAKFDNVKSELKEIEKNLAEQFGEELSNSEEDEDEEDDTNDLYCVACSKLFRTPKAFENHESSKKHKENIEILKEAMLEEEIESEYLDLEENSDILDESIDESSEVLSDADSVNDIGKNKKKKKRQCLIASTEPEEDKPIHLEIPSDDNFDFSTSKKEKKKNKKCPKTKNNDLNETNEKIELNIEELENSNVKKKKDKKKKKEKPTSNNEIQEVDTDHNCVTCKSNFPSKNKLFDHLKKTGHGVYLPHNVKNKTKKDHLKKL